MSKSTYSHEINLLWNYLTNPESEAAKRKFVYPLFMKLFGDKFKTESAASGSDGYVEGQLIIELKSLEEDWIAGLFQGLHYEKLEPKFSAICVITKGFLGLWKLKDLPKEVLRIAKSSSAFDAPNDVGKRNAKILKKTKQNVLELFNKALFHFNPEDVNSLFEKSYTIELFAFVQLIKNLDKERLQIRSTNFIDFIARMFKFFDDELEAIHAFYSFVGYWDITSKVILPRESEPELISIIDKYNRQSEYVRIKLSKQSEFKKFVEEHYVHYNDATGFPVDYYFSRFDEVISELKPEYMKQHGIFFTNYHLCKFTRWFIHTNYENKLHEKYIIFDPAGGSGNLVTSWRGHIHHKIISELQPDLLKTIEQRMLLDDDERGSFTIIPKTRTGEGLNFLDKDAENYLRLITNELDEKNVKIDRPFAFFLNPPYKNTDENESERDWEDLQYEVHGSIIANTGGDAAKERYIVFLSQILNICRIQTHSDKSFEPLLMIFTPTSWLIPRPTMIQFRETFDKHFDFQDGYIITGNEFFEIPGKWPLAFTIWKYNYNEKRSNKIKIRDYTNLKYGDLKNITFEDTLDNIKNFLSPLLKNTQIVSFSNKRSDIREELPKLLRKGELVKQPRYNFYRNINKEERSQDIISGFPLKDDRHKRIKAPHGYVDGSFVGFMDDNTPVRLRQESCNRMSNNCDRVWFRLDSAFLNLNQTKCFSGAPDNRGFCAYDLQSAKVCFKWFAITKALNNNYPLWANQFDIWSPKIPVDIENEFYDLCFAFTLAENICVVTKFEANNPVENSPEIFVDNPLCPVNINSFWSTTLDKQITSNNAKLLINKIKELYHYWDKNFTKGKVIFDDSLKKEDYFEFFDYEPFLTAFSGLVQLKTYASNHMNVELLNRFEEIESMKKAIRERLNNMLMIDFKYFS